MTTERPITFGAPMILALLAGRKSMTRRPVKPQPEFLQHGCGQPYSVVPDSYGHIITSKIPCPYGVPGDRLWVKEVWKPTRSHTGKDASYVRYKADDSRREVGHDRDGAANDPWKSPRFMPRKASRLLLEITAVRVERVQEISEEDAIAEGVVRVIGGFRGAPGMRIRGTARGAFFDLWDLIYKDEPALQVAANPWVFPLEFKIIEVKQ